MVIDAHGRSHKGYSSGLIVPRVVTNEMKQGKLHNKIMHEWDSRLNLPDDNRERKHAIVVQS